jgi:hypothetical protein
VLRRAAAAVVLAALCLAASAAAGPAPADPPQGLRAFLLRADEPVRHVFPRTPSFAWTPVPGTRVYDFQLARSREFGSGTVIFQAGALRTPAVSVPLSLPWMTGTPYALYARVRTITSAGLSAWSAPFGFNTSWDTPPRPLRPSIPGLVRWTPVEGATGYEVWYPDAAKAFRTATDSADEREFYTFHQDAKWSGRVRWRVRAYRKILASTGGLPAVSYGPWSELYVESNPPLRHARLRVGRTVAETAASPHRLTPAFAWSGDEDASGKAHPLYRIDLFTDPGCVNVVYHGAIVGSPAYAPRLQGPLALPTTADGIAAAAGQYLRDGPQPATFTADYLDAEPNEGSTSAAAPGPAGAPAPVAASAAAGPAPSDGGPVALWDMGAPNGRYYWTVLPVELSPAGDYRDVELAQDVCRQGRRGAFAKTSPPVVTAAGAAFVSGLSPKGRLVAAAGAAPSFYGAPLVAWQPVGGAQSYELEVSPTTYPWRPVGKRIATGSTSALLTALTPGTWYYRVRGVDPYIAGPVKQLAWSAPQRIEIAPPVFSVSHGSR